MGKEFWQDSWTNNDIPFHESAVNKTLEKCFQHLNTKPGDQVFVPLCGKALDMLWLQKQGLKVLGLELSETAIQQFFQENNLDYTSTVTSPFKRFQHGDEICLLAGDIFALTPAELAKTAAVYDRGSLVALPPKLQQRYADLFNNGLPKKAKILLHTINIPGHDGGPPYNTSAARVEALYGQHFSIQVVNEFTKKPVPAIQEKGFMDMDVTWFILEKF